jgi:hypothetical protein
MEYENQIIPLKLGFKYQKNELFSISLPKTRTNLSFCLSNFLNNVEEQFDLSFSVLLNENTQKSYWNATSFKLISFSPKVVAKTKRPVSYIKSWNFPDKGDELLQWTGIPDQLFLKHSDPSGIEFKGK